MFNWIISKLTKNYNSIPLFWVDFNLNKYNKYGEKDSCIIMIHPDLKNDIFIQSRLNDVIDYIREHWDMEKLSK